MRKLMILSLMAVLAVGASAQHITPLKYTLTPFNLDSLQAAHPDTVEFYTELQKLDLSIQADASELKHISSQLKAEKRLYKGQEKLLKSRNKQIKAQEKVLKTEEKLHKNSRKELEKQRKELRKNTDLDTYTINQAMHSFDAQEREITAEERTLQQKRMDLNKEREKLKDDLIALQGTNYQLQSKEQALNHLQEIHKWQKATLKARIKMVKESINKR